MANQLYALTGRRSRPTYIDEINARTPYLRGLVQQRKDDKYNEDIYGLEKAKLAESIRSSGENLSMQEKQAKKANALGVVGLGANLWMGSQRNAINKDLAKGNPVKDVVEGESSGGNITGAATKTDIGGKQTYGSEKMGYGLDSAGSSNGFSLDKAFTPSSYKDAVTSPSTWMSGVGGGLVGAEAGEVIGESLGVGGTNERRIVGGALGGAAADRFISGGDIYSNIFSGLLGGLTGYASKDLW